MISEKEAEGERLWATGKVLSHELGGSYPDITLCQVIKLYILVFSTFLYVYSI